MTSLPGDISAYFNKYGIDGFEPVPVPRDKYIYIVVIPALKESNNLPRLLESLNSQVISHPEKILVMITLNNTEDAPETIIQDNEISARFIEEAVKTNKYPLLNIAYIDLFSPGNTMPVKEGGVGLARKTGMDTALKYFDYSSGEPLILGCLDADCTVDKNYFDIVYNYFNSGKVEAAHVEYYHPLPEEKENKEAILSYEIFLRYYVFGLLKAGSPYAFHTIGSTMHSTAGAYVKIGGMNKRKAAEDFYFMEKLSKVTSIHKIPGTAIYPSGRGSFRVPFGTGQRVNRYLAGTHEEHVIYNFDSFLILAKWLELFNNSELLPVEYYLEEAGKISPALHEFLLLSKFEESWPKISGNTKNPKQALLQKRLWFDGFKTLKLIHHLRDNVYPVKPMFPHLAGVFIRHNITLPENYNGEEMPSVEVQISFLEKIRTLT